MGRSATMLLVLAAAVVGCGPVIDGTAKPAPNLKPRPLSGSTVRQVPLDDVALSRMLGQPFVARMPPQFGGPDKLYSQTPPAPCLGVTAMLQRSVYESAEVKDVASESWWNNGDPAQVISVVEGVVTLPTAAQAEALFTKFTQQWQQCNGATTTEQSGPISTTNAINDIRIANASKTIVAATNTATSVLPNMPPLRPTPQARAIGVELNCLVEVEVVFFGDRRPSDPGSANPDTSGVDIAHAMMDKVSALS
jgi:PknH-like extracellular domain